MPTAEYIVRRLWEEGRGQSRGEQLAYIVEHRSHDIDIVDLFDSCLFYGILNAMDMIFVANCIPDGVFDRFQEMVMGLYSQPDRRQMAMIGVPEWLENSVSREFDIVFGLDMVALLNENFHPSKCVFRPVSI